MTVWDELFEGTEIKDGVAAAIRSNITEAQAAILTKGLSTENRWALFKLGYTGAEVWAFWAKRTDEQIQALVDFVDGFGDAQMCNTEITRRKRAGNLTAKQLFEDLVDVAPPPRFSGDAATDPRMENLRIQSAALRARVADAVRNGDLQTAIALQSTEWSDLARQIADATKEWNLRPIEGGIFEG